MSGVNTAFVFVKPHAVNDEVAKLLLKALVDAKIEIITEGSIDSTTIANKGIIDKHYAAISQNAMDSRADQHKFSADVKGKFQDKFTADWEDVVKSDLILNAKEAMQKIGLGPLELAEKWQANTARLKLAPGLYVTHFAEENLYVLNGFYPANREKFTAPGKMVQWFTVEWKEEDLSWKEFRASVVGMTDPTGAPPSSIRGKIFAEWQSLGLNEEPNVADNGIHASAGPLEGLAERQVWTSTIIEEDTLTKKLLQRNVPLKLIQKWLENPVVTLGEKTAPVFDLLEDLQTSEVVDIMAKEANPSENSVKPPGAPTTDKPAAASPRKSESKPEKEKGEPKPRKAEKQAPGLMEKEVLKEKIAEMEKSPKWQPYKPPRRKQQTNMTYKEAPVESRIGRGTVGLGARCQNSLKKINELSYRTWLINKRTEPTKEQAPTIYTRKELHELQEVKTREAVEHHVERARKIAEIVRKENSLTEKYLKERSENRKEKIRHSVQEERQVMQEKKSHAIANYIGEKAEEIKMERARDAENRDSWKKIRKEERELENAKIQEQKRIMAEAHRRAMEEARAAEQKRLDEIKELKRKEEERLAAWRDETRLEEGKQKQKSQELRLELQEKLMQSKEQHQQHVKKDIQRLKDEETHTLDLARSRRQELDRNMHSMVAERKEEQTSQYLEKLEEMKAEKHQIAEEIRLQKKRHEYERVQDHEEYIAVVSARKKEAAMNVSK